MYTLYCLPGTCSIASEAVLHELNQSVRVIMRSDVADYAAINPVGAVPALVDGDHIICEGAAIILHLLEKHQSSMLPAAGIARTKAIESIMFANATMHPAYGRLFFLGRAMPDGEAKMQVLQAAADAVSKVWQAAEVRLGDKPFLGGNEPGAADILLTVYAAWGAYFPVNITIGPKAQAMIAAVKARPAFQKAVASQSPKA